MIRIAERANLIEGQGLERNILKNASRQWTEKAKFEWKLIVANNDHDYAEYSYLDYEAHDNLATGTAADQLFAPSVHNPELNSMWGSLSQQLGDLDTESGDIHSSSLYDYSQSVPQTPQPQFSMLNHKETSLAFDSLWDSNLNSTGMEPLSFPSCDTPSHPTRIKGSSSGDHNAIQALKRHDLNSISFVDISSLPVACQAFSLGEPLEPLNRPPKALISCSSATCSQFPEAKLPKPLYPAPDATASNAYLVRCHSCIIGPCDTCAEELAKELAVEERLRRLLI